MDPYDTEGGQGNVRPQNPNLSAGPENNPQNSGNSNMPVTDRQATYGAGFTMIPPNVSRRNQITSMAQREEQDLQRYRDEHRVTSVQLPPEKLGGHVTLGEARQKQSEESRSARLQKKLKKEEMDRRKREEENKKFDAMKAEQRAKAERLNKRIGDEEQRRRRELSQDHLRKTESFLEHLESSSASSQACSRASKAPSEINTLTKSLKDVQFDHRRVNSEFLDRLEGSGVEPQIEDEDEEVERDPSLVKLMRSFPECSPGFLEDILDQCDGDLQRAFRLLDRSA